MKIINTRERITKQLIRMGFEVVESKANFVFISHPNYPGSVLFHQLKEKGVLVRHFNASGIKNYLRVSIGSDDEMDIFIDILKDITN